jgi:hypothetical protein
MEFFSERGINYNRSGRTMAREPNTETICQFKKSGEVNLTLQQAEEAHKAVRRRGSNIFQIIGSQIAMRLSALRADRPLPPERFLVLISVRG